MWHVITSSASWFTNQRAQDPASAKAVIRTLFSSLVCPSRTCGIGTVSVLCRSALDVRPFRRQRHKPRKQSQTYRQRPKRSTCGSDRNRKGSRSRSKRRSNKVAAERHVLRFSEGPLLLGLLLVDAGRK